MNSPTIICKHIFARKGSLYRIHVTGFAMSQMNTGKVTRNNNDNGISFNGKLLGISNPKDDRAVRG